MERREALSVMGAGAAGIAVIAATESLAQEKQRTKSVEKTGGQESQSDQTASACADCMKHCANAIHTCTRQFVAGKKEYAECLELCADCVVLCGATTKCCFGPTATTACHACAKACEACADACEKLPELSATAEACRNCARMCQMLVKQEGLRKEGQRLISSAVSATCLARQGGCRRRPIS